MIHTYVLIITNVLDSLKSNYHLLSFFALCYTVNVLAQILQM